MLPSTHGHIFIFFLSVSVFSLRSLSNLRKVRHCCRFPSCTNDNFLTMRASSVIKCDRRALAWLRGKYSRNDSLDTTPIQEYQASGFFLMNGVYLLQQSMQMAYSNFSPNFWNTCAVHHSLSATPAPLMEQAMKLYQKKQRDYTSFSSLFENDYHLGLS